MQKLWAEIRRRNLHRVTAGYAVVAWVLFQGAGIAFPAFHMPDWALQLLVILLIAGLPILWVGLWLAHPAAEQAPTAQTPLHHTEWVLIGLLGLVLVATLAEFVVPQVQRSASSGGTASTAAQEASIAVLPFENLSSDKDAGYFAAGVQDEILTRLTKIGALKVVSRTSSAHFASKPDNLPEIAKELGVANIVEGSVQKAADAVHINVQLIRASTDDHLWAESYDRKLDNIFGVEGEVATAIAEALNAKITGKEKQAITVKLTDSPAAYDAYLRGLALNGTGEEADWRSAQQYFEQAVQVDPSFATAWALLAEDHAHLFFSGGDASEARRAAARAALDTAVRLRPDLAEVQLAQSFYQYWVERDYVGAAHRFEQLHAKWPNNADIVAAIGYIARRLGRWDESKKYLLQAIALNPLALQIRESAIDLLLVTRDFPAALRMSDDALNIWPDNLSLIADKAGVYQSMGELDQADALLDKVQPRPENSNMVTTIVAQAVFRHRYAAAINLIQGLLQLDRTGEEEGSTLSGTSRPTTSYLNVNLGDVQRLSGDEPGAKSNYLTGRDTLLTELNKQPNNASTYANLAWVYCGLGDREIAMKYAERAVSLIPISKDALDGADYELVLARVESRFGDRDRAIPALARLLKLPGYLTPAILRFDPEFDKLRGNPRFEALLH
jgi:TolB-like protein/Tfp pilus assembly protein PilF